MGHENLTNIINCCLHRLLYSLLAPFCRKELWCSQCDDDQPDVCTACEAGGRRLFQGKCTSRFDKDIIGCQYYNTQKIATTTSPQSDCIKCHHAPWLVIDPKHDTVNCEFKPDGRNCVDTIPDCWQTICVRKLITKRFEAVCNICTNGKFPSQDKKSCVGGTVKEVSSPAKSDEKKKPSPTKSDKEKNTVTKPKENFAPQDEKKIKEDAPPQDEKKIKEDAPPQGAKKFDEDVPPKGAKKFNEDAPPQSVNKPIEEN